MFGAEAASVQEEFLRLRHRLVPYLNTAMWESHLAGTAPVRPMYYDWPEPVEAYASRGQYMFGADILVAPIVGAGDPVTGLGSVDVWLPPGEWIDFFTGVRYRGGRRVRMFRTLETIPVLVRSGALVPLAVDPMAPIEPFKDALELTVFPGVSESGGSETERSVSGHLIEDDGALHPAKGEVSWMVRWDGALSSDASNASVTINFKGSFDAGVPSSKKVTLKIPTCARVGSVRVDGQAVEPGTRATDGSWVIDLGEADFAQDFAVRLEGVVFDADLHKDLVFGLLRDAQIAFADKEGAWDEYEEAVSRQDPSSAVPGWMALDLPASLLGALVEVVGA